MNANHLTKTQYLKWIKECVGVSCDSVGYLGNGYAYCKIMHMLHPSIFTPIHMKLAVNNAIKNSTQAVTNWKLVDDCFRDLNIDKEIDIALLASCEEESNAQFVEWFYENFNTKVKVVKCVETAKKVKSLKEMESETSEEFYSEQVEKQERLIQELRECVEGEEAAKIFFQREEIKSKEADHAVKIAIEAASHIRDIFEKTLTDEVKVVKENSKPGLAIDEVCLRSGVRDGSIDPVWAAIEDAMNAREHATQAIKDLSDIHILAMSSSEESKAKAMEAAEKLEEQARRTDRAGIFKRFKSSEYEKAMDALKQANYASAVLDVYQNTEQRSQNKAKRDALSALRKAEEALDAFITVVKRSSTNLRSFSEMED